MITVQELRKAIRKESSNKAKFYAGICSIRKQLTNGFGATIYLKKNIRVYDNQVMYNTILDATNVKYAFVRIGRDGRKEAINIYIDRVLIVRHGRVVQSFPFHCVSF